MPSTFRRLRLKRKERLKIAKELVENYSGENLCDEYREWFGVDEYCAILEIEMLGYTVNPKYKEKVLIKREKSLKMAEEKRKIKITRKREKRERRRKRRNKIDSNTDEIIDQNEEFYYIAGYTPGGFPFGITWEEYERDIKEDEDKKNEVENDASYEEIPF